MPVAWNTENCPPLKWLGRDVLVGSFQRWDKVLYGLIQENEKNACTTVGIWWRESQTAYRITLKFSSCIESAEELKKYLNVLQRKKAWNCRNSLSLATTISKGNPGTASLWRRILEIFSEPRSNKEQKWVFVMSTSSMLFPTLHLSGNHDSSTCRFLQWFLMTLSAPYTVQKSCFYKNT